jgi:hypothetical protein
MYIWFNHIKERRLYIEEEKWIREKKEFIKLHISVDEESKKIVYHSENNERKYT